MMSKISLTRIILVAILTFSLGPAFAKTLNSSKKVQNVTQEPAQQMTDFSLTGYGEKGVKSWDLSGESADIFDSVIKLNNVTGNLYGEEAVRLTADKGDFDKSDGKVLLEDNVMIKTSKGTTLTTDSLNWDRKNQTVSTTDPVNIARDTMITKALGVVGEPSLNKVTLSKDVQVDIDPAKDGSAAMAPKNKVTITCDGPLEIDYQKNLAIFKNNVLVDTEDRQIYSDIMEVYFLTSKKEGAQAAPEAQGMMSGTSIDKIVSRGNVKIVSGENVSYSDEAIYQAAERKIVLTGRPRLVIQTKGGFGASSGN